jgi:cysteine desulfurase
MGIEEGLALTAIRFGLGRYNTMDEVDIVVDCVAKQVARLRELSPLYEMGQRGSHQIGK